MSLFVSILYVSVLAGLALFGLHRLHLLWLLLRHPPPPPPPPPPPLWPRVLVQLPVYNEASVAERSLDALAALDYPPERLEVQVLDDSDDETTELVARRIAALRARGLPFEHVRRGSRTGFKAGALAHGLARSSAGLVAIFDADFVPAPDFLRRLVPRFADPGVGVVQAGWAHLNHSECLLTRLQALALDAHFRVEQAARSRSGRFFNFNGTAGIWRREAIESAGGWAADTVTEDLDLSLRAQLCGWRFLFVEDVEVPAELPGDLDAFRSQQRRWARGAGQTARKLLGIVWKTPEVALRARLEATFQLALNGSYPLVLALLLLTVPLVASGTAEPLLLAQWVLFALASGSVAVFYLVSQRGRGPARLLRAAAEVPALFALGLGLSISNGLAYLDGLRGRPAPFVRTPKRGGASRPRYRARGAGVLPRLELAAAGYAFLGAGFALGCGRPAALPFLLLVGLGFACVGGGGRLGPAPPLGRGASSSEPAPTRAATATTSAA